MLIKYNRINCAKGMLEYEFLKFNLFIGYISLIQEEKD